MMKISTTTYDFKNQTITTHFSDGISRVREIGKLPEEMRVALMLLGAKNKLVDPFAGKASDGAAACREASDAVYSNLENGDWDSRGAANGGIWALAVAKAYSLEPEAVAKTWREMDEKKRAQVRADSKVKLAKLEIERERLTEKGEPSAIDVTGMFK